MWDGSLTSGLRCPGQTLTLRSSRLISKRTVFVTVEGCPVDGHVAHPAAAARAAAPVLLDAHGAPPLQEGPLHLLVPRILLHDVAIGSE